MPELAREASAVLPHPDDLRAYVDYLRDLGVYDLLVQAGAESSADEAIAAWAKTHLRAASPGQQAPTAPPRGGAAQAATRPAPQSSATGRIPALSPFDQAQQRKSGVAPTATPAARSPAPVRPNAGPTIQITPTFADAPPRTLAPPSFATAAASPLPQATSSAPDMPAPTPFNDLAPLPAKRIAPDEKPAALQALRSFIGDCTRCPLAYAGRHSIVFADGDPNAKLMFVGEGPGADEDEQGLPFVGKAGQLLNNMINAMGLRREQVFIANIVKCRPPKNRVPEPVEANTCSPFLLQQIDIVQPDVIVALGGTAATYLLGVRQSLTSLRGQWFSVRGARCAVTYHPAFLLRDPRQKGEAWKDLQRVMTELKLKPPARL